MSHGSHVHFLGLTFVLGLMFTTHDMIQCGMTWQ